MMAKYMPGQVVEWDGKQYRFSGKDSSDAEIKNKANWVELPPVSPVTLPTPGQSMEAELDGRSMPTKLLAGGLAAFDRAAYGAKGLFTDLSPQERNRLESGRGAESNAPGKIGSAVTNVALSYPAFSKIPALAGIAKTPLGRELLGILGAGGVGAGYGALTNPGERIEGAVRTGLGAATGQAIGSLASGPLAPISGSSADALRREGVPITIGQSQGWQALEDSMRGGSRTVGMRQAEAIEKWSQNQVNKTMPMEGTSVAGTPLYAKVGGAGRDAIAQGADKFDDVYTAAYSKVGNVKLDKAIVQGLDDIPQRNSGGLLIKSDLDALTEHVNRAKAEFGTGELSGRAIKTLVRSFDKPATEAYNSGNTRLGDAYRAIQKEINDAVGRQFPDAAKAIAPIDKKYAEFLRVQRAAGKPGAQDGVFSPEQLMQSIRDLDKSADKRAFARGSAMPNLLAQAQQGKEVLGARLPPVGPGTAEKTLPALWSQNLLTAVPYMAASALYRPSVQRFLTTPNTAVNPEWLAAWMGALGNAAGK